MSEQEKIEQLETTVGELNAQVSALRELMMQQVALNNITYKGKYDEVIIKLAKEVEARGLEDGNNSQIHEAIRQYLRNETLDEPS